MLDSGSDKDLLFHQYGTPKCFPYLTRQVPKSWYMSNGNFHTEGIDRPLDPCGKMDYFPRSSRTDIKNTTQQCVRTFMNPTLAQRLPTNDQMLCYREYPVFSDTLIAGTTSRQGNKVAQVTPHHLDGRDAIQ